MGSFRDQLARFAASTEHKADKVITEAIEEVGRRLIVRSPFKTGRFRSNWNYQAGAPNIATTDETTLRVVNDIGAIPGPATAFVHYISNSLPYASKIERGWSQQAPSGVVGLTALEWQSIVAQSAAKIAK